MEIKLIFYYLFIVTGSAFAGIEGYLLGKRKGFSPKTMRIYIALALMTGLFGAYLMGQLQNFIMSFT